MVSSSASFGAHGHARARHPLRGEATGSGFGRDALSCPPGRAFLGGSLLGSPRNAPLVVASVLALGCRAQGPPPGVTALRIEDPAGHHEREGFVQLVPPVHLPSSSPERDQVEIWVKLPEGGVIDLSEDEAGRPTLELPVGTLADRVEWFGGGDERRIVDIRGTRIEPEGAQTFYVYRPTAPDRRAPLFGLEWARGDPAAQRAATDYLVAQVAELPPVVDMVEPRRAEILNGVRARNACAGCHGLERPENEEPRQHGLVDRGTDRSGLVTPRTVLWDEVPLEVYGLHDRSWSDPAIEVRCGGVPVTEPGRRCADGSIARGRLRWDAQGPEAEALREAVCNGRAWLLDHMDAEDRASLASVLAPCRKK